MTASDFWRGGLEEETERIDARGLGRRAWDCSQEKLGVVRDQIKGHAIEIQAGAMGNILPFYFDYVDGGGFNPSGTGKEGLLLGGFSAAVTLAARHNERQKRLAVEAVSKAQSSEEAIHEPSSHSPAKVSYERPEGRRRRSMRQTFSRTAAQIRAGASETSDEFGEWHKGKETVRGGIGDVFEEVREAGERHDGGFERLKNSLRPLDDVSSATQSTANEHGPSHDHDPGE